MKILQVIHGFPPYNLAGSEIYTYNLARELAKEDEVYVFHRIADRNLEEYEIISKVFDGLKVYSVNNNFKYKYSFEGTYKNDEIAAKFGELLDEIRPDVVHFGHFVYLSTTLIWQTRKRKIPSVYTLHDFWLACPRGQLLKQDLTVCDGPEASECAKSMAPKLAMTKSIRHTYEAIKRIVPNLERGKFLGRTLERIYQHYSRTFLFLRNRDTKSQMQKRINHIKALYSLVDQFIAPSNFILRKFVEFGIPRNKIIYCGHGFDTSLFSNFSKISSKKIRFGYMGTFIPSKGVHVLLEAFNNLNSQKAELRIHGRFPLGNLEFADYWSTLRSLPERSNINWLGEYNNQDIPRILAEIDVLVVPSIWYENSPLVIYEAFMADVPVITSNIGGMAELVQDGVNGLLFQVGDSKDLITKIQMVMDNPGLFRRFRKNIKPVIPIEQHALEIREIYQSLTSTRNK